ncbi:glutamine amidotransferase-related protein [Gallaecimonas xiamenensis]|uniref:Amidotransferase n=1 Tax=Gallaecimonas xiamenensis 3-C-1 TaxID=745411 RepID=K2J2M4_9GAMM|nr:amidotransferase [Gallaecimonas xiamenensis]EKE77196.1 amidotransferase [Gallaecimonas xiamenensis 3-C-1]
MKIALLQTDILHPEFRDQYQGYGLMFQQLFARAGLTLHSEIFSVIEGVYPEHPEAFDALLVTGSKADAFSDEPWVLTLADYLRARHAAGQKLIGICFGHQLLAHALGGKAERAEGGWGVGVMDYEWRNQPAWLKASAPAFKLICSHRDQVTRLPQGASLLAANAFCPHAAFHIGDTVLAFQGHPEFTPDYGQALLKKRWDDIGTERADRAMASYRQDHDGLMVARVMADFIRH